MDKMSYDCSLDLAQDVIFGTAPKVTDALILLNWLSAHKPCNLVKKWYWYADNVFLQEL